MKRSSILSRVRNKKRYYYCNIGGNQYGLGFNLADAKLAFADLLKKEGNQDDDTPLIDDGITLAQLVFLFDEWGGRFSKPQTRTDYAFWLKRWVKFVGKRKRAEEIRPKHVEDFLAKTGHLGNWSHVKIVRSIRRLYTWGINQGHLPSTIKSPAASVVKPPDPASPDFDYNNWQIFLIYRSRSKQFGAMARFMLATGCRVEEVRAIKSSQVNLAARTITIPWEDAKQGKRSRQDRVIRYPAKVSRMVKRRMKSEYIFRSKFRKPWTMQAVRCTFRRLKEMYPASFPDGATATALRYTFTTRAIMNGVGPVELAKLLGHTDLKMLMKHYQKIGRHEDHLQATLDRAVGNPSRNRSASS